MKENNSKNDIESGRSRSSTEDTARSSLAAPLQSSPYTPEQVETIRFIQNIPVENIIDTQQLRRPVPETLEERVARLENDVNVARNCAAASAVIATGSGLLVGLTAPLEGMIGYPIGAWALAGTVKFLIDYNNCSERLQHARAAVNQAQGAALQQENANGQQNMTLVGQASVPQAIEGSVAINIAHSNTVNNESAAELSSQAQPIQQTYPASVLNVAGENPLIRRNSVDQASTVVENSSKPGLPVPGTVAQDSAKTSTQVNPGSPNPTKGQTI